MFLFIVVTFFCCVLSKPILKLPIQNQNVEKFKDDYAFKIPSETFASTDSSTVYVSMTPNPWMKPLVVNGRIYGRYDFIRADDIFISGNLCYVADNQYGLRILDTNQGMEEISHYWLSNKRGGELVFVEGSYAYVYCYVEGLFIFDVSNPYNPKLMFSIYGSDIDAANANSFFVLDSIAYIISPPSVLIVVNTTNQTKIGSYENLNNAHDVFVTGKYAYVADGTFGLQILDVSNPNPEMVKTLSLEEASEIQIVEDPTSNSLLAYVADGGGGLKVVNVTDPKTPKLLAASAGLSSFKAEHVSVKDGLAYVSIIRTNPTDSILNIYNVSNMTGTLGLVASYSDMNNHGVIAGSDDRVFFACKEDAVCVVDASVPASPREDNTTIFSRHVRVGVGALKIQIKDRRYLLYSDSLLGGIKVLDIIDAKNPQFMTSFGVGNFTSTDIKHYDSILYVTDAVYGLWLLQYDPSTNSLDLQGFFDAEDKVFNCVSVKGKFAYVGTANHGIRILDISKPLQLSESGEFGIGSLSGVSQIHFREQKAFVIYQTKELGVYDFSDILKPQYIHSLGQGLFKVTDLAVDKSGTYVYIADDTDGLKIVKSEWDADKGVNNIQVSGTVDTELANGLSLNNNMDDNFDNNIIYIADQQEQGYEGGVYVIDVTDPFTPRKLDMIPTGQATSVYGMDNYVFVADGKYGIKVIQFEISGTGSDQFKTLCGETSLTVNARDATGSMDVSWKITKFDYCNGHGKCLENFRCECTEDYEGDKCEEWQCGGEKNSDYAVCSGNGECVAPGKCECRSGFVGGECSTNVIVYSVSGSAGFVLFVFIGCCSLLCCVGLCICCILGFLLISVCLIGLAGIVVKQCLGLRKYGKLKNIDILLQEQRLEDDDSVAKLRFNKGLFEIDMDSIKTISILGEGGSNSVVFKALWNGKQVAFKCFKTRSLMSNQDKFDEFEKEVEILSSIGHPNVIRFFGACLQPPRVGILMEFCSKGEILDFVKAFRKEYETSYPMPQKLRMLTEVASALEYLHSRNIVHRDLKCENVLIAADETTKLMDFGLSRAVEKDSAMTKRIGTSFYMAPEILNGEYDEKCDVFSMGIMIYVMITENERPYSDMAGDMNIELKVANNPSFRPKMMHLTKVVETEEFGGFLEDLVQRCWNHDHTDRMTMKEVREVLEKQGSVEMFEKKNRTSSKKKRGKNEQEEEESDLKGRILELEEEVKELKEENQRIGELEEEIKKLKGEDSE